MFAAVASLCRTDVPLFCRHNRFTADCPICSKGTLLEQAPATARAAAGARSSRKPAAATVPKVRGEYAAAGPYEEDGESYEVRLERVPGGLRLAEWAGGELRRRAPVLAAADVPALVAAAARRGLFGEREVARLRSSSPRAGNGGRRSEYAASPGRSGELRDELRVERLEGGRVRVGRWLFRPGTRAWDLQEAPTMLPAGRYAEALAAAAERGLVALSDGPAG